MEFHGDPKDAVEEQGPRPIVPPDNSTVSEGKRQRTLSVKGVDYQCDVLEKQFQSVKSKWKKTLDHVNVCLEYELGEQGLHDNKDILQRKMKELNDVYTQLSAFYDDHDIDQGNSVCVMKSCLHDHSEVLKKLNDRIMKCNADSASVVSKRSRCGSSRSSRMSSAASLRSKRADLAAKAAKTRVELEYLELESQKENELKRVRLAKELKSSKAEMSALDLMDESDDELSDDVSLPKLNSVFVDDFQHLSILKSAQVLNHHDERVSLPALKEKETSYLNPKAVTFKPSKNPLVTEDPENDPYTLPKDTSSTKPIIVDPVSDALSRLADVLSFKKDNDSLPVPKPEVFKGDLLEYSSWMTSFESLIERKTVDPAERLYYLGLYTDGAAKKAIKGLLQIKTKESYMEAKEILAKRFGNPFSIGEAYLKEIRNWPRIAPGDGPRLRDFSDFLEHSKAAMNTVQYLDILNSAAENKNMYLKLPTYLIHKWSEIVEKWISGDNGFSKYPPFSEFCKFVRIQANISCNTVQMSVHNETQFKGAISKGQKQNMNTNKRSGTRSFATKTEESEPLKEKPKVDKRNLTCYICNASHDLDICRLFLQKSLLERKNFVLNKGLCFGCLRHGHRSKDCRIKRVCNVCNKRHPSSLHDDGYVSKNQETVSQGNEQVFSNRVKIDRKHIGPFSSGVYTHIVPVWTYHVSNPQNKVLVYALLDVQSDGCFVKDTTLDKLEASGPDVQLQVSTVLGAKRFSCKKVNGLVVKGYYEDEEIPLPHVYSRSDIPANENHIPRPETAEKWPHLTRIASKLMPYRSDIEVGLLIGINCLLAIKPMEMILGNRLDPYAQRTALGWGILGTTQYSSDEGCIEDLTVNRILISEVSIGQEDKRCYFALQTKVKEIFDPMSVSKMFELDFSERHVEGQSPSHEDRKFLDVMKHNIRQLPDGHYEMPLPFRNEAITLPNNKYLATIRLKHLKRRLLKDKQYCSQYTEFMTDLIEKGYAEAVPPDMTPRNGQLWYIPHHGVYHPRKPDKLRVVFDCSATYSNQSLNQQLLQGPDLTNNLIGVLCRFRLEHIAFVCDIEGMFHQVKVSERHRDVLRFLWWKNGNLDEEPEEYRMCTHLFGATSSPSAANFALKTTADDYEEKWGTAAADFIRNEFYVDDGLKSVATVAEARDLIYKAKNLCKEGGFRLHKFASNNRAVLEAIDYHDYAKNVKSLDLSSNPLPMERTLGILWCAESDTFQFHVKLPERPPTRRGILSTVSSVFDPLGIVSPFTLLGKRILQDLCGNGTDWDEEVPDSVRIRWEKWKEELLTLETLKVPRCYKPYNFGSVHSVELHHFSDASQEGYGQCSYLRLINGNGEIYCSLVMAKSRVTPLKPITIPRLELTAAVVSVRVSIMLEKELHIKDMKHVFWTDSKVVLSYIFNEARRFHVFVGNRVQFIREHSSPQQWKYVDTKSNPADYASRGVHISNLVCNSDWWYGPSFLWKPLSDETVEISSISEVDPEVKRLVTHVVKVDTFPQFLERLEYFSDWYCAKRATAVCLRLQKKYRHNLDKTIKVSESKQPYTPVTVQELQLAEIEIIKLVQQESFSEEIKILSSLECKYGAVNREVTKIRKKMLSQSSSLYKLDPFIDKAGLLRVGGRIRHMDIDTQGKHPVILPKSGHITDLIVCHYHDKVQHQGRNLTLNEIRSYGFWIIGGASVVSRHIASCVKCRKLRGVLQVQRMADLPNDRLEPAPPFTYSAVDYFGPWYVKEGRRELKRYGVLFTCMSSRAIHLEVAHSLNTDSFINSYRRFIGRRGPVRQLRSDQGTNFVGARNELQCALQEMDTIKIQDRLLRDNCDFVNFKMNVPNASHMGGVWERQIRTVRSIMNALLDHHGTQLDDESLHTFMVEAEAIVNSRPLTVDNLNSFQCPEPLTPNHLLTMKSKVVLPPPGVFQSLDQYSRKRWRRVQYLANEFWNRWRREYVQSLQVRQKWINNTRNMIIDDIVLVKDLTLPRNLWKLGRVIKADPDEDGRVRKVDLIIGDKDLNENGKRVNPVVHLSRPIHSLILLLEAGYETGFPIEEP